MMYNQYRFVKMCGTESGKGFELWAWIMWTVLIVGMIVIGSHSIGQLSAHNKYIHTIDAMVKQYEVGCEKPPKFSNVEVKK